MILYDKEIRDDIVATLSYVFLITGGKLQQGTQFNTIIYKLYSFLESDINFDEGITITNTLKAKINEFKSIANTLPDPVVEGGWQLKTTIDSSNYTEANLETEYIDMSAMTEREIGYRFIPSRRGTSYFQCHLKFERYSDGYLAESVAKSSSVSIPADIAYVKVRIQKSTSYKCIADFYNENDELISSSSAWNVGTSYKASQYACKLNAFFVVGGTMQVLENVSLDFTIEEENLSAIDVSLLNVGDKYYAESVVLIDNITVACIIGKKINDISKDEKYEILKARLGHIVSKNTGVPLRYITILKSQIEEKYYAIISDYQFWYHGFHASNNCDYFGATETSTARTYCEAYTSVDGIAWESTKENAVGLSGDGEYKYGTTTIYLKDYVVFYTNYNMYLSNLAPSGTTIPEGMVRDTTWIPTLYRKSDEKLTLGTAGVGTAIRFGTHKIEDSKEFPLVFQVLDLTDNLNLQGQKIEGYAKRPNNAVVLDTIELIDALTMTSGRATNEIKTLQNNNTPLHRWLNSSKGAGNWFVPLNEDDAPPTAENNSGVYGGYHYAHRRGFLNGFSPSELNALLSANLEDGYTGKVFNLQAGEDVSTSNKKTVKPALYRYNASYRRIKNYVEEIAHHIQGEKLVGTSNSFVWRRTMGNIGYYYMSGTTASPTKAGYNDYPISPCIFLSADLELIDNEDGTYSPILPEPTEFSIETVFDTALSVGNKDVKGLDTISNIGKIEKSIYDTCADILAYIESVSDFDTRVEIRRQISSIADTNRIIIRYIGNLLDTAIKIAKVEKVEQDSKITLAVNREILADTKTFIQKVAEIFADTLLKISNVVSEEFETRAIISKIDELRADTGILLGLRNAIVNDTVATILKEQISDFDSSVRVSKEMSADIDTSISISKIISSVLDTVVNLYMGYAPVYDTSTILHRKDISGYDTEIKTAMGIIDSLDTNIKVVVEAISKYDTCIDMMIAVALELLYDTSITLQAKDSKEYDVKREIHRLVSSKYDTEIKTIIDSSSDFDTVIDIVNAIYDIYDTLYQIGAEVETLYDTSIKTRLFAKNEPVILERVKKETDENGLSRYNYIKIKDLKCNIYDVKNSVEPLPALVSEKTRYIVITRDKTVRADNVVNYRGKRYIIEAITRNRVFTEIYLKED